PVQWPKVKDGGRRDDDMLAGGGGKAGGVEVAVVRRGDADRIDPMPDQFRDRIRSHERGEVGQSIAGTLLQTLGPGAGAAGDGGQLDLDQPEVAAEEARAAQLLEDGSVGVV